MSYNKRTWATGNVVGAVDLNRMEQGIEDAGSGQVLVVNVVHNSNNEVNRLDKTWQEIYDAFPNVYIKDGVIKSIIVSMDGDSSMGYQISDYYNSYSASTPADYPQISNLK